MAETTWARWDGITRSENLDPDYVPHRHHLFDAAERHDWPGMFGLLAEWKKDRHINLYGNININIVRPDDPSWYTLLHHAALGNAPTEVVEELLSLGHFRSVRCAAGERPVDIARGLGHRHLIPLLEPEVLHPVTDEKLTALQHHFHQLILENGLGHKLNKDGLRLPPLELLLERDDRMMTFLVAHMSGGWVYRLEELAFPIWMEFTKKQWVLLARSFVRLVDWEGLYVVTSFGSLQTAVDAYD